MSFRRGFPALLRWALLYGKLPEIDTYSRVGDTYRAEKLPEIDTYSRVGNTYPPSHLELTWSPGAHLQSTHRHGQHTHWLEGMTRHVPGVCCPERMTSRVTRPVAQSPQWSPQALNVAPEHIIEPRASNRAQSPHCSPEAPDDETCARCMLA